MKSNNYQIRYQSSSFGTFALLSEHHNPTDAYRTAHNQAQAFRKAGCNHEADTIRVIPPGHEQQ